MAVKFDKGSFYRPGGSKNENITDSHINRLGDALYTASSKDFYKSRCKIQKGKALMFYNQGSSWDIDPRDWKNKGGDVKEHLSLFK